MYRGYDIAELAEHSSYEEVAYLLLEGELPATEELEAFKEQLAGERALPPAVTTIVDGNAMDASPMETLRTAVSALSFSDPAEAAIDRASEHRKAVALIAQLPTIIARYERRRRGEPAIPPDPSLGYAENFLAMLRGQPPTAEEARAFEVAMILHAEHELNASTFAARVVAGTNADMHSAIVAALCALKGPLTAAPTWRRWRCSRSSARWRASPTASVPAGGEATALRLRPPALPRHGPARADPPPAGRVVRG
jgi:citrate synthase